MKKYYLGLSIGFLALTATFLATSVAGTKAADETSPLLTTNPCAYMDSSGKVLNIYNNPNLTTDKIISLYHEKTNDEFNRYIGLMIKSASVKSMLIDKNGSAPVNDGECASNRDNYSTFCVAHNMLSDEEQGDGYMQYLAALQCRSGDLSEDMNSLAQPVEYISGIVQEVAYTTYSIRQGAIEREKNTAKRALDQTLSAYDELKTAWLMHKKYIEIYEALLTYRDKMVEIRHQVEEFPAKFIDATTTKCT